MKLKTTFQGNQATIIGTAAEIAELLTKVRHVAPHRVIERKEAVKPQGIVFHEPFKPKFNAISQTREEIVKEAIADVAELLGGMYYKGAVKEHVGSSVDFDDCDDRVDFFINKTKRAVVAKLWLNAVSDYSDKKPQSYATTGIARCAPSDVFNEHVGKAIALRRALGLPVPTKYYEVGGIAPEGKQVGDVANYPSALDGIVKVDIVDGHVRAVRSGKIGVLTSLAERAKVIDDSARNVAPSTPAAKVVYVGE